MIRIRLLAAKFLLVIVFLSVSLAAAGAGDEDDHLLLQALEILKQHEGVWDSKWEFLDQKGEVYRTVTGTERSEFVIEDRVLLNTTEIPALDSLSKSMMYFHPIERKLYFFSVDRSGNHWILTEEIGSGVLISHKHTMEDGSERMIRFRALRRTETEVDVVNEGSIDSGVTWIPTIRQYLRKRSR